MSARKRKAARQVAYRAGPLSPWTPLKRIDDHRRMLANRGRPKPMPTEIGRVDSFRLIYSPEIPKP